MLHLIDFLINAPHHPINHVMDQTLNNFIVASLPYVLVHMVTLSNRISMNCPLLKMILINSFWYFRISIATTSEDESEAKRA